MQRCLAAWVMLTKIGSPESAAMSPVLHTVYTIMHVYIDIRMCTSVKEYRSKDGHMMKYVYTVDMYRCKLK